MALATLQPVAASLSVVDSERPVRTAFLRGLSHEDFANAAARIMGDVNYIHPFREGNGRTQLF